MSLVRFRVQRSFVFPFCVFCDPFGVALGCVAGGGRSTGAGSQSARTPFLAHIQCLSKHSWTALQVLIHCIDRHAVNVSVTRKPPRYVAFFRVHLARGTCPARDASVRRSHRLNATLLARTIVPRQQQGISNMTNIDSIRPHKFQ